jgi:hypothetical protein
MRRELPMILAFSVGLLLILDFFVPALRQISEMAQNWFLGIFAFSIIIGIFSLIRVNYFKIRLKQPNWGYSIILFIGFAIMALLGFFGHLINPTIEAFQTGTFIVPENVTGISQGTPFDWMFDNLMFPMSATMFSLLAFFVASASYRAFRARNVEATLLLVAAVIVMLGQVPIGTFWWAYILPENAPSWLTYLRFDTWKDWIMEIGNTAGQRAIMIGAALGVVSTSLRILLGIERSYLGE